MAGVGVVEVAASTTNLNAGRVNPVMPGVEGSSVSATHVVSSDSRVHLPDDTVSNFLDQSLERASFLVSQRPTSTTLVSLAHAQESCRLFDEARSSARSALELSLRDARSAGALIDPAATRVALEILFRLNDGAAARELVSDLPLTPSVSVVLAGLLGDDGAPQAGLDLLTDFEDADASAVRGYLLLLLGKHQESVGHLRTALRIRPEDANTALNLSLALTEMGARRKALAAAQWAARVGEGRQDISLHYLELLVSAKKLDSFDREVAGILASGVVETARLQIVRTRAALASGDVRRGIRLLDEARKLARVEGSDFLFAEAASTLVRLRFDAGKTSRASAYVELLALHKQFSESDTVVVNLAQMTDRRSQAPALREANLRVMDSTSPARAAFLEYQLSYLEGENAAAACAAQTWYLHDGHNSAAAAAAVVAVGIGMEMWDKAAEIASDAMKQFGSNEVLTNNCAYVLAMAGRSAEAIELVKPLSEQDSVYRATLGLAYLADGRVAEGMALYRRAGEIAEKEHDERRSLMTAYQALIVRQLGLQDAIDELELAALALPAYPLPDDWQDRPEFLRLYRVCQVAGYEWPLTL